MAIPTSVRWMVSNIRSMASANTRSLRQLRTTSLFKAAQRGAVDGEGKEMQATVFSAFAAQDSDSDRFHVEMNGTRNGKKL